MGVSLVLVAAAGVAVGLSLAFAGGGWPEGPGGELTLALLGPVAVLLGSLGAAGVLDSLVDVTSPTVLWMGLVYAALPGLLLLVLAWSLTRAGSREAVAVPFAGALLALGGPWLGHALPIPDGRPAVVGLGLLLVASAAPRAVREVRWSPPSWLGRRAAVAVAGLLTAVAVLVVVTTAAFGAPQGAGFRWEATVEAPAAGGASFTSPYRFGVQVPFLEATEPSGEEVLAVLRSDVGVAGEAGGMRVEQDGRAVDVMLDPGETVTVAADVDVWGRTEHTSAASGARLPTRNVSVSGPTPNDGGNLTVSWRYTARGNGCSVDARLEGEVPAPGEARLEGGEDVREDGRFQAVCR